MRPDFLTDSSAIDWILLTLTMSPEYPQVAPCVSVSSDILSRQATAQLSAAIATEAGQLIGQPMMLDECCNTVFTNIYLIILMMKMLFFFISV